MLPVLTVTLGAAGLTSRLFDQQPLRFEENRGQAAAEYRYLGRLSRGTLGLTAAGMDLFLEGGPIRTRFLGANQRARLEPVDRLSLKTSYFQGSQERGWNTAIASYARIRYRGVYRGIDLVFYGRGTELEYDFEVAPGADPAAIHFAIEGSQRMRVDTSGELVMATAGGEVRWKKPEIHQTVDGRQKAVSGGYVLDGHTVALETGAYDASRPLVIDPVLSFSTYLGASGNEAIRGMAADSSGNIYVTGSSTSANLPATGLQRQFGGKASTLLGVVTIGDAFVAKFSPAGALLYLTYLGGSAEDVGSALAVDKSGNVYVTGYTDSNNFPVTAAAAQKAMAGRGGNMLVQLGDAFVAKIGPNGDQLIYSTFLGGRSDDYGSAIAVDAAGNAYVAGGTLSDNLPVTLNAAQTTYKRPGTQQIFPRFDAPLLTSGDAFIAKINPAGASFLSLTYLGGNYDDLPWGLALDSSGNVYVGGNTLSTDFPVTNGALQPKFGGADLYNNSFFNLGDGFVTKLTNDLSAILYSTYLGGTGDDAVTAITVDGSGNAYVTGGTTSQNLGTSGALQHGYNGPFAAPVADQLIGDAFVAKINPDGKSLGFFTYLGGNSDDVGMAIALDASGNIVVTGSTQSLNFPVSSDALQAKSPQATAQVGGGGPGFLSILDPGGKSVIYSSFFGGTASDVPTSLAIDSTGAILVAGAATSPDFPLVKAAQSAYGGGSSDAFVAKFTGFSTPPAISTDKSSLSFSYQAGGGDVPAQNVQVTSAGAAVNFTASTSGGSWLSVTPSSGITPAALSVKVNPAGLAAGLYNGAVSVSAGAAAPLSITVKLTVSGSTSTGPSTSAAGIANVASYQGGSVSPGEIVVIFGSNMGPTQLATLTVTGGKVDTLLAGTQVLFDGAAAPLVYTSAGQLAAIVPYSVAGKSSTQVVIQYNGASSAPVTIPVAAAVPGLFTLDNSGKGQGSILNEDNSVNGPGNPAARDAIVVLFVTGEGQTNPPGTDGLVASSVYPAPVLPVTVTIGGQTATPIYAGAAPAEVAGVMQVNVKIPAGITPGNAVPVAVTVGTASSPAGVTLAVK